MTILWIIYGVSFAIFMRHDFKRQEYWGDYEVAIRLEASCDMRGTPLPDRHKAKRRLHGMRYRKARCASFRWLVAFTIATIGMFVGMMVR